MSGLEPCEHDYIRQDYRVDVDLLRDDDPGRGIMAVAMCGKCGHIAYFGVVEKPATLTLTEEQRQVVIMALAFLARDRPGWEQMIGDIARQIDPELGLFTEFRTLPAGRGFGL